MPDRRRQVVSGGGRLPAPLALLARYWFDPRGGITLGSGFEVASWTDRISGLVASQSTATRRPTYSANNAQLGGNPGLSFVRSALQTLFGTVPVALSQNPYDVWTEAFGEVANLTSSSSTYQVSTASRARLGINGSGTMYHLERNDAGVTAVASGSTTLGNTHAWLRGAYDGANIVAEDSSPASGTVAAPARPLTADPLGIGSGWDGSIGHVVVFDRALTAPEAAQMRAFMGGLL